MSREVYEPSDDTQLVVRALHEHEPEVHGLLAVDVGTGSGAIARVLADRGARVVAVDITPPAVADARALLGPVVMRGDLLTALRGPFDIVAFNAPYLPSSEDERVEGWLDHAFHGGVGGIEVSERFVRDLRRVLAPGGRAYLVTSSNADQDGLARTIAAEGFRQEKVASARFFFEEIAVWKLS